MCCKERDHPCKSSGKNKRTFDLFRISLSWRKEFAWFFEGGKGIRTQIMASGGSPDSRLKTHLTRELQDSRLTSQIRLKTQDSRLVSGDNLGRVAIYFDFFCVCGGFARRSRRSLITVLTPCGTEAKQPKSKRFGGTHHTAAAGTEIHGEGGPHPPRAATCASLLGAWPWAYLSSCRLDSPRPRIIPPARTRSNEQSAIR